MRSRRVGHLRRARLESGDGADADARRRSDRGRARRGAQRPVLAHDARREAGRRRAGAHARRQRVHGHRRDAGGLRHAGEQRRAVEPGADRLSDRRDRARSPLPENLRAVEARRDDRAGAGRLRRRRGAAQGDRPGREPQHPSPAAAAARAAGRRHAPGTADPVRRGRLRAAHRVRELREPAARARRVAPARDLDPRGARRGPAAARGRGADRERALRGARRSGRAGRGLVGARSALVARAGRASPAARDRARRASPRLHARRLAADRRGLRSRARDRRDAARGGRRASRGRAGDRRLGSPPAAQRARRIGGRARRRPARGLGAPDQQLLAAALGRTGLRPGRSAHYARRSAGVQVRGDPAPVAVP